MSGHSKWSTIKHDKGVADAKRGKLFSRLSKEISIAVREGGSDSIDFNPRLRVAVEKARAANMPKDNIARAIDKGAGRGEGNILEEITYEGFGPNKVAFMIVCVTDNRNRTNSEIRSIFDKNEGALGSSGSTSYFFTRKGVIDLTLSDGKDPNEAQLELIDLGADDIQPVEDGLMRVIVDPSKTHAIAETIAKAGYKVEESDIAMVPTTTVELTDKEYEKFERFFEVIDDHDDVQKIFHNAKKG